MVEPETVLLLDDARGVLTLLLEGSLSDHSHASCPPLPADRRAVRAFEHARELVSEAATSAGSAEADGSLVIVYEKLSTALDELADLGGLFLSPSTHELRRDAGRQIGHARRRIRKRIKSAGARTLFAQLRASPQALAESAPRFESDARQAAVSHHRHHVRQDQNARRTLAVELILTKDGSLSLEGRERPASHPNPFSNEAWELDLLEIDEMTTCFRDAGAEFRSMTATTG